jgi:hypothetical protein
MASGVLHISTCLLDSRARVLSTVTTAKAGHRYCPTGTVAPARASFGVVDGGAVGDVEVEVGEVEGGVVGAAAGTLGRDSSTRPATKGANTTVGAYRYRSASSWLRPWGIRPTTCPTGDTRDVRHEAAPGKRSMR